MKFKKWIKNFTNDFLEGFKKAFLIMLCVLGLGVILLGPGCIIIETGIESLGWIYLLIFPASIGYINACLEWIATW